ncbi:polyprenol monophosphomannose synthase [Corynebacterium sp. TAE3-ERU12]|uniref:polyprenol monophosphomannose synthase n=1 Tax=Corynebacterium sp. TAE3-ERU12 TaxID=2849491 RepID=UPI001C48A5F5|nr:polyprenol monophosphomannose synthase [Corynebacterium sp. TAE3-ERU12]MBV7295487.1 polyprenol monophosphomannose synthase [Corynebacterium sp. TAE3-ERU12]
MTATAKPSDSTLVIIPTFNERESLPLVVQRLREAEPHVDVLIVDDNSPDGTGDIADEMASADEQIHVLHRKKKDGLWDAYRTGFEWGLERDYKVLCEMDADGSHAPEQLHRLLNEIDDGAELVIGSRYVRGGRTRNWPKSRYLLSRGGNVYIALALGTDIADITAGYRAFRREVLEELDLSSIGGAAYMFQTELGWKADQAGFYVEEVPITFVEREYGESKMDPSFVLKSLANVTTWAAKHRATQVKDFATEVGSLLGNELKHEVEVAKRKRRRYKL